MSTDINSPGICFVKVVTVHKAHKWLKEKTDLDIKVNLKRKKDTLIIDVICLSFHSKKAL